MLNEKTLAVKKYLEDYFKLNSELINPSDVHIDGLTPLDIILAFGELNNIGFIKHISQQN